MPATGQQELITVLPAVVKAPFTLLKVEQEPVVAHAVEFGQACLGKAPEALDAVDVVFAPGKLVGFVVDAAVGKAAQDQPVVGAPAAGVNVALGKNVALDDGQQFALRAVLDHADKDLAKRACASPRPGSCRPRLPRTRRGPK